MTDREKNRLMDILDKSFDKQYQKRGLITANHTADDLLANGVIVPPCKVGDKIYRIAKDSKTIIEEQIGNAHIEFTIDNGTGIQDVWWLKDYNIGKTVFLTKEEAEKKLKELKENEKIYKRNI